MRWLMRLIFICPIWQLRLHQTVIEHGFVIGFCKPGSLTEDILARKLCFHPFFRRHVVVPFIATLLQNHHNETAHWSAYFHGPRGLADSNGASSEISRTSDASQVDMLCTLPVLANTSARTLGWSTK